MQTQQVCNSWLNLFLNFVGVDFKQHPRVKHSRGSKGEREKWEWTKSLQIINYVCDVVSFILKTNIHNSLVIDEGGGEDLAMTSQLSKERHDIW